MFNAAVQDDKWLTCVAIAFDELDSYFDDKTETFEPAHTTQGSRDVIAFVREPEDRFHEAVVCAVPDGRLFYIPVGVATGTLHVDRAEEILNPPLDLRFGARNGDITFNRLGALGSRPEPEARKALLAAYYGHEKASELYGQFTIKLNGKIFRKASASMTI